MIITLLPSAYANLTQAQSLEAKPSEFLDMVRDEKEFEWCECKNKKDKLYSPGFILAEFKNDSEKKSMKALTPGASTEILCFDLDAMDEKAIAEAWPIIDRYDAVVYTTFKNSSEAPRLRLLVALAEPLPLKDKKLFKRAYLQAAEKLNIQPDAAAMDCVRLSFFPQRTLKNTELAFRHRFTGKPLVLDVEMAPTKAPKKDSPIYAGDKPWKTDLRTCVKRMRKSPSPSRKQAAGILESILSGEGYAEEGSRHNATLLLAFELVRDYPYLSAEWFRDKYLVPIWQEWDVDLDASSADWCEAVESAKTKHAESRAQHASEKANYTADRQEFSEKEVERVKNLKGRLVISHRSNYFVYSPKCNTYKGPYKATEVPVVVRDCLSGIDGIEEGTVSRIGYTLRSAVDLSHRYGTTAKEVIYHSKNPKKPWDDKNEAICLRAYNWIKWDGVYHEIVEDLLTAVAGDKFDSIIMYLNKFRDLTQPLPALTFVGPPATWKSRISETLSRFWCDRDVPTACKAQKVLNRFNMGLLKNPVVWSDEKLAKNPMGKAMPEEYRESISATAQTLEPKGSETCILKGAVRHVIAVNNEDKLFSHEVDADSVEATMERFLLINTDAERMENFEKKWADTPELERLREGHLLLEHVVWLEKNLDFDTKGRLFLQPNEDKATLMAARFQDDTLNYIWQIAIRCLQNEAKNQNTAHKWTRLPLIPLKNELRFSPQILHDLWNSSKVTEGVSIKKPSQQKIGRILQMAGFKKFKKERASKHQTGGWIVEEDTLFNFIEVSDFISLEDFKKLLVAGRVE